MTSNYCVYQKCTAIRLNIFSIQFALQVHTLNMHELPCTIKTTVLSGNFPHARTSTPLHPICPFSPRLGNVPCFSDRVGPRNGPHHYCGYKRGLLPPLPPTKELHTQRLQCLNTRQAGPKLALASLGGAWKICLTSEL